MPDLRATVVIDYQNVHLTGHDLFARVRAQSRHETLIDPLLFANSLLRARNQAQKPGYDAAVLRQVLVYRGHPVQEHDFDGFRRGLAQQAQWRRDRRVQVELRPLKYDYERDATGQPIRDINGKRLVKGTPREKGIDVLCALAVVRAAQDPATDIVILASADSDLAPALDEVRQLATAKVETASWFNPDRRNNPQLRSTDKSRPVWNTRLDAQAFHACLDVTDYT